jgi:hypothetical protein
MAHLEFLFLRALEHEQHGIPNLEKEIDTSEVGGGLSDRRLQLPMSSAPRFCKRARTPSMSSTANMMRCRPSVLARGLFVWTVTAAGA